MRYKPDYIPNSADARWLVEYLTRELNKVAQTLDHGEATTLNYGKEVVTTGDGTCVLKWKRGPKQRVLLNNNVTLEFVDPEGVSDLTLVLEYTDAYTPTFPSSVYWAGGVAPTWTSTGSAIDIVHFYFDGAIYHACACPLDSRAEYIG